MPKVKVECPKCKGTGRTFDHWDGITSLGIDYIFQCVASEGKKICSKCNGKGTIKIKK